MATRSVVFNGPHAEDDAWGFYRDIVDGLNSIDRKRNMAAGGGFTSRTGLSHLALENIATASGGTVQFAGYVSSSDYRELDMYDYKQHILPMDRLYLASRDQTGRYLVNKIPDDLWRRPPKLVPTNRDHRDLNEYLGRLHRLGYFRAARAAHKLARRDGGAFVFVRATGNPSEPLTSDHDIRGFQKVPASAVHPQSIVKANTRGAGGLDQSPLVKEHGIQSLQLVAKDEATGQFTAGVEIHGSRLQSFNEEDAPDPGEWYSASVIDVNHDDLWNWRDIMVAKRNAQIQGNPIAVDVEVEEGINTQIRPDLVGTDDDPATVLQEELEEWQQFGDQHFSSVEGAKLRRVGPADLEPSEETVTDITTRIAQSQDLPAGMVFPNSVQDRDARAENEAYYAVVQRWDDDYAWHRLLEMVQVGQEVGRVRRLISWPVHDVIWPDPQYYNAREQVFVLKSEAQAMRDAALAGAQAPAELSTRWPDRSEAPPASQVAQRASPKGRPPGAQDGDGDATGSNASAHENDIMQLVRDDRLKDLVREVIEEEQMLGRLKR